jgi:hypothetical protein
MTDELLQLDAIRDSDALIGAVPSALIKRV